MAKKKVISINRAPVLTLWAAIVAQRLDFNKKEALTLGKAVAGLNAQAKGRRLGIFKPHEQKAKEAREMKRGEEFWVEVLCWFSVKWKVRSPELVGSEKGTGSSSLCLWLERHPLLTVGLEFDF